MRLSPHTLTKVFRWKTIDESTRDARIVGPWVLILFASACMTALFIGAKLLFLIPFWGTFALATGLINHVYWRHTGGTNRWLRGLTHYVVLTQNPRADWKAHLGSFLTVVTTPTRSETIKKIKTDLLRAYKEFGESIPVDVVDSQYLESHYGDAFARITNLSGRIAALSKSGEGAGWVSSSIVDLERQVETLEGAEQYLERYRSYLELTTGAVTYVPVEPTQS